MILLKRYMRFCIVGGSGAVVDMSVVYLLTLQTLPDVNLTLIKAIAAELAVFNNFIWNDVWTFRPLRGDARGWRARLERLARFNLICLAGIGLSILLLNFQVQVLGLNTYLANACAIIAVSVWNFVLNLKVGWRNSAAPCAA